MERRSGQLGACKKTVVGDEIYSDGGKTYVISKAKMASVGSEKPASEEGLLEFFKTHADSVLDDQTDIATENVGLSANATETAQK